MESAEPPAFSPRRTRSRTKQAVSVSRVPSGPESTTIERDPTPNISTEEPPSIRILPADLIAVHTKLPTKDHRLLLKKQAWLKTHELVIPRGFRKHASTVEGALVFAQEEAGTAVCISAEGLLLTCSHCVAETAEDLKRSKSPWLLFKSGRAVKAECVAWDPIRDLALLQVVAAQARDAEPQPAGDIKFPFVRVSDAPPVQNAPMVCVGHPGSEDLEASQPGILTNYDVLHVSAGRFRGYAEQDLQDNSEIGALMHDCWTYWGHSGAPLVHWGSGTLVGLHSSWDDETGMRRGVAWEAIREFLQKDVSIQ